jgi:hypothetical protein
MPSIGSPGLIDSIVPVTAWYADDSTGQAQHIMAGHEGQPITDTFYGPYTTQAEAQAQASSRTVTSIAKNAATSVASDTLKPLFQSAIWLRVGEVVVGLILLGIGLNALLKGKPMSIVTGAAGTVGKAAIL